MYQIENTPRNFVSKPAKEPLPWLQLMIGQSFFVPRKDLPETSEPQRILISAAQNMWRRKSRRFSVRLDRERDGFHCIRIG